MNRERFCATNQYKVWRKELDTAFAESLQGQQEERIVINKQYNYGKSIYRH